MTDVNSGLASRPNNRNPRLENFNFTFKLFFKNKIAFFGFVIVLIYVAITILDFTYPKYLGTASGSINSLLDFTSPSHLGSSQPPNFSKGWWYFLGTTTYNQYAIFPAMLAALKIDIPISFEVVFLGAVIGVIVGTTSGFIGGAIDEVVMRVTDVFFSVPFIVLVIAFIVVLSNILPGFEPFLLALIIVWWPIYARVTRGQALSIKSQKFIEAAVASGASRVRNIFVHVLPNVLAPVFVQISLDLGTIVLIFSTLFYLGFSEFSPNLPELGNIMVLGINSFSTGAWWTLVIPGLFLLLFTISVNLMGDGLRDVLDPKIRR
jgi:peptide/nickel transport system permease protein